MLVKLTSSTSGEMVIYAEHLRPLFELLEKACTARGVFTLDQLPIAIERLQKAADEDREQSRQEAAAQAAKSEDEKEEDVESAKVKVGLSQRAYPLIQLMKRTLTAKGFILWEATRDF